MSYKYPLLVIQCGNTFPEICEKFGDFDQWFLDVIHQLGGRGEIVNAHQNPVLPDIHGYCGVLITGSPAMVTDKARWSEDLGCWLAQHVGDGVPILGVCYGHQLLAHALGGEVDYQPGGREIGSLRLTLQPDADSDRLFSSVKDDFHAHLTHSQSVVRIPPGARLLASSSRVEVQALHFGFNCWGLQFHPEFNEGIMGAYLQAFHRGLPTELRVHLDPRPCNVARSLLEKFISGCLEGSFV
jgi:GMP synthase (glutamine-hydrolysing)